MTSTRTDLEAALAEAQARLDAATPGPWRRGITVGEVVGAGYFDESPLLDEQRLVCESTMWKDLFLIVAAVNREQRAIDHTRKMLARAERLQFAYAGLSEQIIASLHEWWCTP